MQVRRDERRVREELTLQRVDGPLREQRIAVLRDHDRIDYEIGDRVLRDAGRDGFDELLRAERAGLGSAHLEVPGHDLDLLRDELGSQEVQLPDSQRVLRRDQRERTGAIDAEMMEGLEVRLDPSTAP